MSFPSDLLVLRASVEIGRGAFDAARARLDAAKTLLREDLPLARYHAAVADLAIGERRFTDAVAAIDAGLARVQRRETAQIRVQLCATGLRAHAELAAHARARRDAGAEGTWLLRAGKVIAIARKAASDASAVTPNADGWLALAAAEYERARGIASAEPWCDAATAWDLLERPAIAAYCRWREAEALVATGSARDEAGRKLREAYAVAVRTGAQPLREQIELLAQRARLQLRAPDVEPPRTASGLAETLGLTAREAEVLELIARGLTNREIAAALVISARTAGVHVSRILRKLGAPNRVEAAAIAHRAAPLTAGLRRALPTG
jgi:DNA-binding CsgD family transcriptional regulator